MEDSVSSNMEDSVSSNMEDSVSSNMEDSVSSTITSSLPFYMLCIENGEDEEEAAEREKREKQIEENILNAFDDHSDEDNNDDDGDDDSQSSDEESVKSSHQKSQSYTDHPYVKESFESEERALPPNETSNFLSAVSHLSDHPEEHSQVSESECSHHSDENHSNNFVGHRTTGNHYSNGNLSELNSDIITNGQHVEFSKKSAKYNEAKRLFESVPSAPDKYKINSTVSDLEEKCTQLQILFQTRGKELEQMRREELKRRQIYDQVIKSLKLKLTFIEGEKERLCCALQESEKLNSDFRNQNNILKKSLGAIELKFSAEKEAKENALSKLQSAEVTIHSMDQQIKGLTQSENAIRLQDQSESIINDLKLRHQKEVLQLKEEIDKLQENLKSKVNESESMLIKMSHLQQKCEDLQVEKREIFNKLSSLLENSQRQCEKLLESGSISEMSILKFQIQHLQEEKSKLETQNSALKDEVKSLEGELQTCEALKNDNEESVNAHSDKKSYSQVVCRWMTRLCFWMK